MKSGNLNFLGPSGPLQACNGTALPLPLPLPLLEVLHCLLHKYCRLSIYVLFLYGVETAQSVEGTGWTVRGSSPGRDKFFFSFSKKLQTYSETNPVSCVRGPGFFAEVIAAKL
jgi:hypothetical protein